MAIKIIKPGKLKNPKNTRRFACYRATYRSEPLDE